MEKRKIFMLLWLLVILIPIHWLTQITQTLRQVFRMASGSEPVHVVVHLILFGSSVFLFMQIFQLPLTRRTAVLLACLVLALGVGQEWLQLQVKERVFGWPEIFDLGVDLAGGFLGWLAYKYYLRYARYLRIAYYMLRDA